MKRLDGKVCVITGAAGGIGASSAELFRGEGATVVGVDLSADFEGVDLARGADVADEEQVIEFMRRARSEYGRIDVLFNHAGISPDDDVSVLDTSLEAWQRVQDVNLRSVFLCCKHGIPHLLDGGGGSVSTSRLSSQSSAPRPRKAPTPPRRARFSPSPASSVSSSPPAASASTPSARARSTRRS